MPKISVIVPVYNVEQYVSRCIDSILKQTYTNWELVLVNDGSLDKSGEICDEYALRDCRLRVCHKVNGGVSSARNMGLDIATGDWITFLDSDDYLSNNTLECLANTVEMFPSVEVIDFPILRDAGSKDGEQLDTVNSIVVRTSIREIDQYWFNHPRFESCGRFFRRDLLAGLRFDTRLRIGEDTVFFMHYLMRCTTMVAIPNGLYAYCYRESSAMGSVPTEKLIGNDLLMLELMGEKVWERPMLASILYRMIIPKLQGHKMKLQDIGRYRFFLSKITLKTLIYSPLPIRAKIIVLVMKQFVRIS